MPRGPWWIDAVTTLLAPVQLGALALGALWQLSEQLRFVRDNVEPALLEADFSGAPDARAVWAAFEEREAEVDAAVRVSAEVIAAELRSGALGPVDFRQSWERLGFTPNGAGAGTPADDHLDGLFQLVRLTTGEPLPAFGTVNLSSRAHRIADFLAVTEPTADDVVFDLGSGSGKVALTVAASSFAQVRGVELGAAYAAASAQSALELGLRNLEFVHADVREADLSAGSSFFLYYPFHGEVALAVAQKLGRLAREKELRIYASGPLNGYGEHFLAEVDRGALELTERRGEFAEVMVLRSARG